MSFESSTCFIYISENSNVITTRNEPYFHLSKKPKILPYIKNIKGNLLNGKCPTSIEKEPHV